ncbi:hypothetical protein [Legionella waltersii]|uniref:Uncharacterized protein n=1 Tax=Legionella waltersii TaxID=66969 RepID=A0A0W1ADL2_9GAMM|nr:hypothetical protein [Legionella waltersii]KTD79419.1 hypothetical protein Lwal_1491 [Legionella waltersii]SNU97753.1 Uncharacterised protein [Legionella waltersii]
MTILSLHVIHLYEYQKPESDKCPVEKLKSELNPLVLSTCMRHIYIFSSEQLTGKEQKLEELLKAISTPQPYRKIPHCEHLQGNAAYQFLLYWLIGGKNPKKQFSDERVLGEFRKTCESYKTTKSENKRAAWEANKYPMLALEADGKHLLQLTNRLSQCMINEKIALLEDACKNCTWARSVLIMNITAPLDYEMFTCYEEMLRGFLTLLQAKKSNIHKELAKLSENESEFGFFFSENPKKLCLEQKLSDIVRYILFITDELQHHEKPIQSNTIGVV